MTLTEKLQIYQYYRETDEYEYLKVEKQYLLIKVK